MIVSTGVLLPFTHGAPIAANAAVCTNRVPSLASSTKLLRGGWCYSLVSNENLHLIDSRHTITCRELKIYHATSTWEHVVVLRSCCDGGTLVECYRVSDILKKGAYSVQSSVSIKSLDVLDIGRVAGAENHFVFSVRDGSIWQGFVSNEHIDVSILVDAPAGSCRVTNDIVDLACGGAHSCCLTSDGMLLCFRVSVTAATRHRGCMFMYLVSSFIPSLSGGTGIDASLTHASRPKMAIHK